MAAIEMTRLTKYYGRHRGIEDITMIVEEGEVFGLLGPNGAGKTTTIRTLLDLLHPTSGSARIFGFDCQRQGVQARARLGNLPGDFGYGKRVTGRQAVSLLARLRGVRDLERVDVLAERFRADLDRPLGDLSRGNRQKVGLILAFFHRPNLLILDEPTSGLDPLMQETFLALVREERERGCAVFISSHELDEIERICDRVGIVRGGTLIAIENVEELLSKTPRRVSVLFDDGVAPRKELEECPGVANLVVADGRATFTVVTDPDPVLNVLAGHPVADLEFAHPTLEEVFLSYYEDGPR